MIEIRLKDLNKLLVMTNPERHRKAASRAINETLRWVRKEWIVRIREKYALKTTYLKERVFEIRRSTPSTLEGRIIVRDKKQYPLGLAYPAIQTAKGVRTEFLKGRRFVIPSGFLWSGKAWRRKKVGDRLVPRKPIVLLKGPGTPVIARSREITDRILATAVQKVIERYESLIVR